FLGLCPGGLFGLLLAGRGLLALRGLLARARLRLALAVAARFVAARAAALALAAATLATALAAALVAIAAAVAARAAIAAFALWALAFGGCRACGRFGGAEQALEPADDATGAGGNRRRRALRGGLLGCRLGARFAHRRRLRGLHVGHRGGRRHVEVRLGQGDGRDLARRAAAVAGLARFLAQFVLAQARDLVVRGVQLLVGHDHDRGLVALLDLAQRAALFVEQ